MNLSFNYYFSIYTISFALYFSACTQRQKETNAVEQANSSLGNQSNVLEKEALLYWNNFSFDDTTAVKNPDIGEQALVDFIAVLTKVSDSVSSLAIKNMLSKAKAYPVSFQFFTQQYERYLYDPNSPMRNDSFYEPVLEFFADSIQLNKSDKYRYNTRLKLLRKNKVGTKSLDFEVELVDGKRTNLYNLQSPFTLLFFYEPGCSHCEEVIVQFQNTPALQNLTSKGRLKVLAVYTAGNRKIWKGYQEKIPRNWINGFDWNMQILSNALYDVKASPTIYLLDEDKKVVLKDTDLSQLALFFGNIR